MAIIVRDISEYLKSSRYIDWMHELVLDMAARFRTETEDELELTRSLYHFVRERSSVSIAFPAIPIQQVHQVENPQ